MCFTTVYIDIEIQIHIDRQTGRQIDIVVDILNNI